MMRGIGLPIKLAEQKEDHIYDTNSVFTILVMPELTLMHVWVYYSSTATCYCIFYVFDRTLFVLAWTPPPGLTTSHVCLQSLLVHWLSHLAVGSSSVWTHMRTAPGTPCRIRNPFTPSQISHEHLSVMRLSSTPTTRYLMLKVAYHS